MCGEVSIEPLGAWHCLPSRHSWAAHVQYGHFVLSGTSCCLPVSFAVLTRVIFCRMLQDNRCLLWPGSAQACTARAEHRFYTCHDGSLHCDASPAAFNACGEAGLVTIVQRSRHLRDAICLSLVTNKRTCFCRAQI